MRLTISAAGGELQLVVAAGTSRHQASLRWDEARVTSASQQLIDVLARGARARNLSRAALADLRTVGEELYLALFPPAIRDELAEVEGRALLLEMDERFVAIPWELAYDGRAFLCRRFDLGRAVLTPGPRRTAPPRELGRPARIWILCSDVHGDLPAVLDEGEAVLGVLEEHRGVEARLASGKSLAEVRGALADYDLVHFVGHAEYVRTDPQASGWHLADGTLAARDLVDLAGGRRMPLVVFANACASAHETSWRGDDPGRVFGMASAFLLAGVGHYLGTQWEIVDAQSRIFARAFYAELGRGRAIGAAVRRARDAVIVAEGESSLGWAAYVLYGDPGFAPLDGADAPPAIPALPTPSEIASRDSIKGVLKRRPQLSPGAAFPWVRVVIAVLLFAAALVAALVLR